MLNLSDMWSIRIQVAFALLASADGRIKWSDVRTPPPVYRGPIRQGPWCTHPRCWRHVIIEMMRGYVRLEGDHIVMYSRRSLAAGLNHWLAKVPE